MAGTLNNSIVVRSTHTPAAAPAETYTMLRAATLQDALAFATNAGGGAVTVRRTGVAVSSAMSLAAGDLALARTTSAVTAQKSFVAGDLLETISDAATTYEAYVWLAAAGVAG